MTDSANQPDRPDRLDKLVRLAEQDRAETAALRADVRSLIEALRDRFGGNGQNGD